MKVCYCLATTDLEGGTKSLLDLLDEITKCDDIVPVVILTKKYRALENILKQKNIAYKVIFHGTDAKSRSKIKTFFKIIVNRIAKQQLKHFLKSNKIDLVHNNSVISLIGMEAAKELAIPYVCHVRENIESGLKLEMTNYEKLYELMNQSNSCVFISHDVRKRYEDYLTIDGEIIYDGINLGDYSLTPNSTAYNFKKILMVGRIAPGKRQLTALKALNFLRKNNHLDYTLTLIGTIGDEVYYKSLLAYMSIHDLEDFVTILPYSNDLSGLRSDHGIALVCSENEGLGRVTVEGMLSRQLVIGAGVSATAEIIQHGVTGLLYELDNEVDLAEKILSANDSSFEIIEAGFDYASLTFDNYKAAQKIIKIYDDILKGI